MGSVGEFSRCSLGQVFKKIMPLSPFSWEAEYFERVTKQRPGDYKICLSVNGLIAELQPAVFTGN